MSQVVGTVESMGFTGKVYQGDDRSFVAWELAKLSSDLGKSVAITGVTGEKGSPQAAAYNITHGGRSRAVAFVARVLRPRIRLTRHNGSIMTEVPGAYLHAAGLEQGVPLTLRQAVGSADDLDLAALALAQRVVDATARGAFASLYQQGWRPAGQGEEAVEETAEELGELL